MSEQIEDAAMASETHKTEPFIPPSVVSLLTEYIKQRQRWWLIRNMLILVVAVGALLAVISVQTKVWDVQGSATKGSVAVVQIHGAIGVDDDAKAESIIPLLRAAFENKNTQAVLLHISSPGGSPTDADRISTYAREMSALHNKPLYSHIDGLGASAAYMIAVAADEITASKYSLVGSIGAILSVYDYHKLADKVGVNQRIYKSGALKDMLSGGRAENEAERAVANELVTSVMALFYQHVADRRKDKLTEGREYLTTGRVWVSPKALSLGLIDEIGTLDQITKARWGDAPLFVYRQSESILDKLSGEAAGLLSSIAPPIAKGAGYAVEM